MINRENYYFFFMKGRVVKHVGPPQNTPLISSNSSVGIDHCCLVKGKFLWRFQVP